MKAKKTKEDSMGSDKSPRNINLQLPPGEQAVHYSNIVIISHSPEEVVLDFAQSLPGKENPEVVSRIIMTPRNAKMFLKALRKQHSDLRRNFGPILLPNQRKRFSHSLDIKKDSS